MHGLFLGLSSSSSVEVSGAASPPSIPLPPPALDIPPVPTLWQPCTSWPLGYKRTGLASYLRNSGGNRQFQKNRCESRVWGTPGRKQPCLDRPLLSHPCCIPLSSHLINTSAGGLSSDTPRWDGPATSILTAAWHRDSVNSFNWKRRLKVRVVRT